MRQFVGDGPGDLLLGGGGVDVLDRHARRRLVGVAVDADDDRFASFLRQFAPVGVVGDGVLDEAAFDRRHRAALLRHLRHPIAGVHFQFVGQALDEIGAGQRIGGVGDARFIGKDLLGAQRERRRFFGRQRQRFVVAVGMQAFRAAEHGRKRLVGDADDVVERLLRRQRDAAGLRVKAHHLGAGIARGVALADRRRPEPAGGAKLGRFFEQIGMGGEEKAHPRRELVDAEASGDRRVDVGQTVGERERDLLRRRRARFPNVVARHRDRVTFYFIGIRSPVLNHHLQQWL